MVTLGVVCMAVSLIYFLTSLISFLVKDFTSKTTQEESNMKTRKQTSALSKSYFDVQNSNIFMTKKSARGDRLSLAQ